MYRLDTSWRHCKWIRACGQLLTNSWFVSYLTPQPANLPSGLRSGRHPKSRSEADATIDSEAKYAGKTRIAWRVSVRRRRDDPAASSERRITDSPRAHARPRKWSASKWLGTAFRFTAEALVASCADSGLLPHPP